MTSSLLRRFFFVLLFSSTNNYFLLLLRSSFGMLTQLGFFDRKVIGRNLRVLVFIFDTFLATAKVSPPSFRRLSIFFLIVVLAAFLHITSVLLGMDIHQILVGAFVNLLWPFLTGLRHFLSQNLREDTVRSWSFEQPFWLRSFFHFFLSLP